MLDLRNHRHLFYSLLDPLIKNIDGHTVVKVKVAQSCLTLCDPMDPMEFSRPEYWSG